MLTRNRASQPNPSTPRRQNLTEIERGVGCEEAIDQQEIIWIAHRHSLILGAVNLSHRFAEAN